MGRPLVPTIGLEVHVQLATRTRLLSAGPVPGTPEAETCPIDPVAAGHPGTLPVLNAAAVGLALRAALALGCTVHRVSRFDRKHYFWPDLPKGYQVTQHRHPLATEGTLWVAHGSAARAHLIERVHLEEDAASLRHRPGATLVDLGRCGVPLVEVVGAPDLDSPAAAEAWARMLHRTLVAAGVTEGRLEQGHLRIDANVSLAPPGAPLGTRVELKNLNSFRFLRRALDEEVARQQALLTGGGEVRSETRRWTGQGLATVRAKEVGRDYCWLPEPDLPVLSVGEEELAAAGRGLPAGPLSGALLAEDAARRTAAARAAPGLGEEEQALLAGEARLLAWVEQVEATEGPACAEAAARLAVHDLRPLDDLGRLEAAHLAAVAARRAAGSLSHDRAVGALHHAARTGALPELDAAAGLDLGPAVAAVLDAHPGHEARWRAGSRGMEGFFMGRLAQALPPGTDRRALHEVLVAVLAARRDRG